MASTLISREKWELSFWAWRCAKLMEQAVENDVDVREFEDEIDDNRKQFSSIPEHIEWLKDLSGRIQGKIARS